LIALPRRLFERYFLCPEFTALPHFSKARLGRTQRIGRLNFSGMRIAAAWAISR
jgi:hypothetical protein